ncbi:hypothetical protein [Curtobacterium sp. BRD11]|uniref:hypothetical protein n=1 Tax=Curtobacterium sp. BRD11 TaxID=2962581 RepID=UPI0028814A2F|nr:hypothetical protein [Curtobacterium sp. BRD11]MDT0211251.1 hypothetical protein [Curtobacterium sp. BRD11]
MGVILLGTGKAPNPNDPIENEPMYPLGPNDYAHRYAAERLTGGNGTAVSSWPDLVGSGRIDMQLSGATGQFVLATDTGEKVVVLSPTSGIDRKLTANGVAATGTPGTIAMVVRVDPGNSVSGSRRFASGWGARLEKAANHNYQYTGSGGGMFTGGALDSWAVVIFETDGTSPMTSGKVLLNVNGAETTTLTGPITASAAYPTLSLQMNAGTPAECRYAEVVHWNRQLNASERAQVLAAMQNRYAFI